MTTVPPDADTLLYHPQTLRPIEVRMLLKRFEQRAHERPRGLPGKVDCRKFIDFVRARQPSARVDLKLKRIMAKAELGEGWFAAWTAQPVILERHILGKVLRQRLCFGSG
jgi:hypothetical protein